MTLLRRCTPIGEGSRQRTEDTVGGGARSLCALEVLTYRAADHMVVVVMVLVVGYLLSRSCLEMKPLSSSGPGLHSQPNIMLLLPVD